MTASEPVPLGSARRTHPLSLVFEVVAVLSGVMLLVVTVEGDRWLALSVASSVVGLVALVARWWMRTYTVTEDRLLLDEGVLRRRHRVVPYARIQQVNVTQELLHRLVSMAAVDVETAGEGGTSSVSLRVLRREDAEALRAYVLERRRGVYRPDVGGAAEAPVGSEADAGAAADALGAPASGAVPPGAPPAVAAWFSPERVLGRMAPEDLLLAGATGSGPLVVAMLYAVVVFPLLAVGGYEARPALLSGPQIVLVLVAGVVVVWVVAAAGSVATTLVQDWRWTMTEQGDDLYVRRGMLALRSQSLPRRRVQQVTVIDNPVRRAVGVVSVALHTAAMPGSQQATVVRVPLVRRSELDRFLAALMGPDWALPALQPRPERARWRALRRRVLLLMLICGVPVLLRPDPLWVLVPFVLVAWPWAQAAHRRAGLAVTDGRVVFASGVLHHRIDLAPRHRLQSTRTSASPLQRRVGLVTLHVDLAGTSTVGPLRPSARLFDVDAGLADRLLRELPLHRRSDEGAPGPER